MTILILLGMLIGIGLYLTAAVGTLLVLVVEVETKREVNGPIRKPKHLPKSISGIRQVFVNHAKLFPNAKTRTVMLLLAAFPVLGFLFLGLYLSLWFKANMP